MTGPFRIDAALRLTALIFALLAAEAGSSNTADAQPGDFARSLAAEVGVVGDMGEPNYGPGFAESVKCRVRPQDEVWVISSRHLGWPACEEDTPALKYWRWDCGVKNWRKHDAAMFKASESAVVATVVYIHGNRVDSWKAVDLGWYSYDAIVRSGQYDRPVRYVIYSWPSTRIRGTQLNDLRCKADRTNAEAYYVARVLSATREDVPVCLIGFSYGARIISGGLHVAAGGEVCGNALPTSAPRRGNIRSVLMAGALHNYWMHPGCFHGQALQSTDRMLILANSCDKVLRRYHWLFRGQRPKALGTTGLSWYDDTGRVKEFDCCCCVGKTHDSLTYLNSPQLVELTRQYALWVEAE